MNLGVISFSHLDCSIRNLFRMEIIPNRFLNCIAKYTNFCSFYAIENSEEIETCSIYSIDLTCNFKYSQNHTTQQQAFDGFNNPIIGNIMACVTSHYQPT